ncbi:MAG: topoisomerase DNA-binding C4 zinc finger domain-containing protein [Oscillospiraceae bacterium]|nr:topoisomerase DNA-binding C4 zinc finger domain-containing protein [Oscillospiraceae bacterium]
MSEVQTSEIITQNVIQNGSQTVDKNTQETEPSCPKCGKPLVLRTAKKGENAGKQFYGCSGFPKCRYTCEVEGV